MRSLVALIAVSLLAGCADAGKTVSDGGILSLAPVRSETFQADYQRLAECAYRRLEQPGLHKSDFPASKSARLTLDAGGGVRAWEIVFTAKGPNTTTVDLAAVRTMWGPDTVATRPAMPAVRNCAAG